jgi:hypothetical protein
LGVRRAGARAVAAQRAHAVQRQLAALAADSRPIVLGPWLGEVGFELLYWIPFLRWFAREYAVSAERLLAVSRGGAAAAWYGDFAGRAADALDFMSHDEFRRKNARRSEYLGEQKQVAATSLEEEILAAVNGREAGATLTLHPAAMYRLFAPYWWGHQPLEWVRRFTRYASPAPATLPFELPANYTAVKFYFNDCFRDTRENRRFVEETIRQLSGEGPVISLSTGIHVDDHAPCEPDVAAMRSIREVLTPANNLIVQSAIVARARRFVGTYGGFAYVAPLSAVPAITYFSEPGTFSLRHLELARDVARTSGRPDLLQVRQVAGAGPV